MDKLLTTLSGKTMLTKYILKKIFSYETIVSDIVIHNSKYPSRPLTCSDDYFKTVGPFNYNRFLSAVLTWPKEYFTDICEDYFQKFHKRITPKAVKNILLDFEAKSTIIDRIFHLYKQYDSQKPIFDSVPLRKYRRRYDPYKFYLLKDSIGDEVLSARSPLKFSDDRTSPILLINNEVFTDSNIDAHHEDLLNQYKEKHNIDFDYVINTVGEYMPNDKEDDKPDEIRNIAVGSQFNRVVLLEYIAGSISQILSTFQRNGFKKVYVNNESVERPYQYKRLARRLTGKSVLA